ncbi:TPA: transposase [Klebsiella variicola]|nr:transposase [Klebsiella variicola]HCA5411779.1 transposase [Klebsiella variicola]HDK6257526.1 transposase [Klebsiella variicola]HDK6393550.1 transposase [Klebsiella variicola]HDU5942159.1 transposase [Klebsiella variicola]
MQRIEVITGEQKRRRYTPEEKARFVALAMQPGYTVSLVARQYGIWIGPYVSIHFLSLNPLLVRRRRYSRGERYPSALCGCHSL